MLWNQKKWTFWLTLASLLFATTIPLGYSEGHLLKRFTLAQLCALMSIFLYFTFRFEAIRAKLYTRSFRIFLACLGSYAFWFLLASLWSPLGGKANSSWAWFRQFGIGAGIAVIVFLELSLNFTQTLNLFYRVTICSGAVLGLLGIAESFFPNPVRKYILSESRWFDSLFNPHYMSNPAASLFEHYNILGVNQAICAVLVYCLGCAALAKKKFKVSERLTYGLLFCLFCFGIVVATSKTGFVALLGGLATLLFAFRKRIDLKISSALAILSGIALLFAGVAILHPESHKRLTRFLDFGGLSQGNWSSFILTALQGRDQIYRDCWETFKQFPVHGAGFFQTLPAMQATHRPSLVIHAHNIVLMHLVAGGFVGFALFVFIMLGPHLVIFQHKNRDEAYLVLTCLQVTMLLGQTTELFLEHVFWFDVFYFSLMAMLWQIALSESQVQAPRVSIKTLFFRRSRSILINSR